MEIVENYSEPRKNSELLTFQNMDSTDKSMEEFQQLEKKIFNENLE